MIGPVRGLGRRFAARHARLRSAYTLIEILVSTALTLMLLMAVVQIFGSVSDSIANSRAALEMTDQLRAAQMTLQRDLEGVTVTMSPPRRPESGEGYFEYTEGPIGPAKSIDTVAMNNDLGEPDSTVGDIDDMLMFTTRTRSTPFVGRVLMRDAAGNIVNSAESQEAEVAWFVRGRTLYRRVLLVLPNFDADLSAAGVQMQLDSRKAGHPQVDPAGPGFFKDYDISVRNAENGDALAANSLSDLTKPENRFAHRSPHTAISGARSRLPFHPHFTDSSGTLKNPSISRSVWANLGLPILRECSYMYSADGSKSLTATSWVAGALLPDLPAVVAADPFDAWLNPHPWSRQDSDTGCLNFGTPNETGEQPQYMGSRIGEDVVLTNVIGFDVKAWDPGAPVMMLENGTILLPGDRGYLPAVKDYVALPNQNAGTAWPRPISYGAYVDLNYLCQLGTSSSVPQEAMPDYVDARRPANVPTPQFHWAGDYRSRVRGANPSTASGTSPRSAVYDTWSTHYECDGVDTDGDDLVDEGTDGFDRDVNSAGNVVIDGVVDDAGELEAPPPYPVPLRGIQVRIRVFEPASRQIREVTVVQDFLPK